MPAYGRHHTAQYLHIQKHHFLIDCGEGTQERLKKFHCKPLKINHIFISHLHGDHYLGLMGLLFTMHLLKRTNPLHLYGQRGLQEIITTQLKYSDSTLNYRVLFHELTPGISELLYEDEVVEVRTIPLNHRIPCSGFLFKEKPKPYRINKDKLPENILLQDIAKLKQGIDVTDELGNIIYKKEEFTLPPRKSRVYAYCSDTKYDERILPYINGADLLYHEATFVEEKAEWAEVTYHSTTTQAATIAKMGEVGQLMIGHYSARYRDVTIFMEQAKKIFSNTILAHEGEAIDIPDL